VGGWSASRGFEIWRPYRSLRLESGGNLVGRQRSEKLVAVKGWEAKE